jgi:hypothetical protein
MILPRGEQDSSRYPSKDEQMRRILTVLLATGLSAALPAAQGSADTPTITNVTPSTVAIGAPRTVTFTTTDTFVSAPGQPTATITRSATAAGTSPETFTATSTSVSGNKVTATFNVTLANPGAYDAAVSGPTSTPPSPSTTDSCMSCLTLTSSPTVTSVQPPTTGADFSYPNWTIRGSGFAAGPYKQCTALPCSTTSPNVAVYNGAALDPAVKLDPSSTDTSGTQKLQMSMTIDRSDVGGNRTVTVTNTDGKQASCTCLHIAPAMTLTSVSPGNLPAGSSGQSLVITGTNFPSDTTPEFIRGGTGPTTDVTWSHESVSSDGTQILLSGVAVAASAPDGNEDLRLTSLANNFAHEFPNAFAVGGNPPSGPGEAAPTSVTASPGDQQAFVQWTPPASSTGDPITGYTIQTLPSGPTVPEPSSASAGTVGPLTNGQSYTFTVTVTYASTKTYTSVPSNSVTPSARPDAPTNVNATAGNKKATVTWTAPASTDSPIDSYTVTASPGGTRAVVFGPNGQPPATQAVVSGLKNGTSYTFTVTAHNASGTSNDSAPSNSVTPKGDPSLTLLGPKAIDTGKSARLRGRLLDSNGSPVAGAKVTLRQRHAGAHQYGPLKSVTTTKHGRYSLTIKPRGSAHYKATWKGNAGNNRVSAGHTVNVRETGRITSPKNGSHRSAGPVTVHGHASSGKGDPVALQERVNGKWRTVTGGTVGSHGKVALRTTLTPGTTVMRLKVQGGIGTVTGYSPTVRVNVS